MSTPRPKCPECKSSKKEIRKTVHQSIDKVDYWMYYKGPCDHIWHTERGTK